MYDFDQVLPRIGTNSWKWDQYNDPDIIALSTADMDFKSPQSVVDALVKVAQGGDFNYHCHSESYYQAIIGWYKRKYNWDVKKEWILNTPGIWASLHLCLDAYTKPGDFVLVQAPHFSPITSIVEKTGRRMLANPMILKDGRYFLDMEDFEKKVAENRPSMYFMVNPHNPTCHEINLEELKEIVRICRQYHVVLVSDEVHANILYDDYKHYPVASISKEAEEISVIITGASKGYNLMDLTYCILTIPNPELYRKYLYQMECYNWDFAINCFGAAGVEAAFSPEVDPWMEELNKYLAANLDYMMDYFEKYIPEIRVIRPESCYLTWLDCRGLDMTPQELREFFLKTCHVGLTWGDSYGPYGEGFERLNIGCPRKTLEEGLRRIRDGVASLKSHCK